MEAMVHVSGIFQAIAGGVFILGVIMVILGIVLAVVLKKKSR